MCLAGWSREPGDLAMGYILGGRPLSIGKAMVGRGNSSFIFFLACHVVLVRVIASIFGHGGPARWKG